MSPNNKPGASPPDNVQPPGLYRTVMAGPGRSLADAFDNLDKSPHVSRVLRHAARDLLSARVNLTPEEGSGYWELTRVRNDIYVILSNFSYKNPRFEFVPGDGLVQFNFKLSGDLNYGVSRPGPLRFNRPSLHVWRQPKGTDMREWTAPSAHERMVSISARPEFLLEHFLPSGDVPPRLRAFVSASGGQIDYCQMPLTAQMMEITAKLIDNPYRGNLYLAYVEALTLELLCAAIGNFWSLPERPTEEYSERELRALNAARQLLMEQLAPPPTLPKIARAIGMAEKALTRGFKTVYGETLFDFSLRCRMQHALTLLRDQHCSVDEVSEATGYSHPTSFATAFRRHFGMRPIDCKRLKVRQKRD
jgi:AraC-like DNA-binding protein